MTALDRFLAEAAHRTPVTTRIVHYVSYGTPGGEYPSVCRAAMITGVGAWLPNAQPATETDPAPPRDGDVRKVIERYHADACSLTVFNPSGMFLKVCRHDPGDVVDRDAAAHGAPVVRRYPGGTWHWPSDTCICGGTT